LVLANFPFSDDFWWLKPEQQTDDKKKKAKLKNEIFGKEGYKDLYGRFGRGTGFKSPPAGYGDYAFILHILSSLTESGRGGIVCPQGVLSRGQPEIREGTGEVDENGYPKIKRRKADDEYLNTLTSIPGSIELPLWLRRTSDFIPQIENSLIGLPKIRGVLRESVEFIRTVLGISMS